MSATLAEIDLSRYDATVQRHAAWLDAGLDENGAYRGGGAACGAYMPLPVYGHAVGRQDLMLQSTAQLETFFRNGELALPPQVKDLMPYIPAWLVMGATLAESMRLRSSALKYLLPFQDRKTGGFFGKVEARDAGRGVIDFDSSTQACGALCISGQSIAAVRCGEYLKTLIQAQPDPENRFFLQWDSERGLIREFDPKEKTAHVLVYAGRKEHLYKMGLLVRALGLLHGLTGDAGALQLAETLYRRTVEASPDIWTNTLAHKMAWAAWTLFHLTRNGQYARDACRMADHLATLQQADGGFIYPELFQTYADMPRDYKYNIGTQFATWIVQARAMAALAAA